MPDAITVSYHKADVRCAIAGQATFGTANTTQAEFYELHVTDIVKIDASSSMLEDATKRSDGSRVETITDIYRNAAGGEYTVQVSGIATRETLSMLIYACMQDIAAETDSGTFSKTFEWDESTTQKLASGLPNYILTFLLQDSISTENKQLHTCVVKSLTLESEPGSNAGRMKFTATLYSGFPCVTTGITCTPASWVAPTQAFYVHQLLQTKTVGGSPVVVGKFSLALESEVMRGGYSTTGAPQFYGFGTPKVTGSVDVKYDNVVSELADAYFISPSADGAGDFQVNMVWGVAAAAATPYLAIDVWAIYNGDPWETSDQGGVLFRTVPFKGVVKVSTSEAVEIVIEDNVNRAWI
jgi:hypothetical protein